MTKQQYKEFIRLQKKQAKPCDKLTHLLINYRSHNSLIYPPEFTKIMKEIRKGQKLFNSGGLWSFYQLQGNNWRQPSFSYSYYGNTSITFGDHETKPT